MAGFWKDIALLLRAAGYVVYAPTLTGLGERVHLAHLDLDLQTHLMDIANVLAFEELDQVVLVGHSCEGMVITGVADRAPERVLRLIYLDGLVPHHGEAAIELVGPQVRPELERQVRADGDGWLIPVQRGENDSPTHNVPHPFKSWTQLLELRTTFVSELACAASDARRTSTRASFSRWHWKHPGSGRAARWPIREIETVHRITPDPAPKATALLDLL